jgi:hypothetical protein
MNELSETHLSGFIKYTRMDMTKFGELVEMVRSVVQKRRYEYEASRQAVAIRYLETKKCSIY